MPEVPETIVVTEEPIELPVAELLTGRGFITGKSGSGKSNTASVIAEELLEVGLPMLIVDTDGEYFGLQERYEILHTAVDDGADMLVDADDAERLAGLALDGNVPIILDLSGYVDPTEGTELITRVIREIFRMEDARRKPFLIIVEEIHEYLPEQGAHGEVGELLIQVAKRGRKRGLGLCGISQRPAAVDKNFITQCDWLVWHRLTWKNDTTVVRQLLGADSAASIQE
ncbi:MAG: ATP-binding protein, partial [Halobacteriota archaeon]